MIVSLDTNAKLAQYGSKLAIFSSLDALRRTSRSIGCDFSLYKRRTGIDMMDCDPLNERVINGWRTIFTSVNDDQLEEKSGPVLDVKPQMHCSVLTTFVNEMEPGRRLMLQCVADCS